MSQISIGKELLEVAIEIEKNGRIFYEYIARGGEDKEVRDIFMRLATREKEHENMFRDMLSRLGGYQPPQEYSGEHYQYIKDLADSSIFTSEWAQALLINNTMTDVKAMEAGIGFEKDSILFYSEMRGMVPREDQDIVDMIVSEEQKHLSELTYITNKLKSGK